ncbi:EAL domain-containing protein, partial [Nostoc sp. NIES-2111]
ELAREDVFVEFQPKIDARDLTCCGAEALVRMRDSNGKVVPPGVFVPVAESCGLIDAICRTVMRKSVEQAREWQAMGLKIPVAVNVSPIQFARPDFAESLADWVRQTGLEPGLLEIEVTESTAMSDIAGSEERLRMIADAGIRIAIDDFGTGFSNISQLSRLPYDVLKIDRSLVSGIGEDARSETILASLIAMAEGLGYETVAEGVETTRQAAFLQRKGCTALQGYLFA